jgi:hypothetical protein
MSLINSLITGQARSDKAVTPEQARDEMGRPIELTPLRERQRAPFEPSRMGDPLLKGLGLLHGGEGSDDLKGSAGLDKIIPQIKPTRNLEDSFFKAQQSWESDHGSVPMATHDSKKESKGTFDIGFGHKITPSEMKSGKIHGITFKGRELTAEDKNFIQKKDLEANSELALKKGWSSKLKKYGLNWDTLDQKYKLPLMDLAYNVGAGSAQKWDAVFEAASKDDPKMFVKELRRKDAGKYTRGMDNRAARAAKAAGLINTVDDAKKYGLPLTTSVT